jgi:hypothetical protein
MAAASMAVDSTAAVFMAAESALAVGMAAAGVDAGAAILGAESGYYGGGCWQSRPVYDAYGRYLGNRNVEVC